MPENDQDDYSFSSQSDDFESSNEYQKLEESSENIEASSTHEIDIERVMNQSSSEMSKSMLHCLDGNETSLLSPSSSFEKSRKRHFEEDDDERLLKEESSSESLKRPLLEKDLTDF